jgi:hypothetical protein
MHAGTPCLVHLVRAANGLDPLRAFAAAMRAHPPGIEHELVLAMKGFASQVEAAPYLDEVADFAPNAVFFPDAGLDLGVYFATAARLRRGRYCFVNSYTRPLVAGWLAKLNAALDLPGVGLVGATASWSSGHSWQMYSAGLPSAYRGLLPPVPVARQLFREIEFESKGIERDATEVRRERLRTARRLPWALLCYEPFPARFVRSNVFMLTHACLRELRLRVVRGKDDAYALEGSRMSITRQLERLGLSALVVDRAGAVFGPQEWYRSRTLWQGDQEGLLVGDNQTLSYANGGDARRQLLSALAWGPLADPCPPREGGSAGAGSEAGLGTSWGAGLGTGSGGGLGTGSGGGLGTGSGGGLGTGSGAGPGAG